MPDQVNIADLHVVNSPADVANWPITRQIQRLEMAPAKGFVFTFDQPLPENWKWPSNPANPEDNWQYTVWVAVQRGAVPVASGIVQMWQNRENTGAFELPTFRDDFGKNWCYDGRWGQLQGYRPEPGSLMGFFVSAGNARGEGGVTSVRERSNIVVVTLPGNDRAVWHFDTAVNVPPVPTTSPVPPSEPPVVIPSGSQLDTLVDLARRQLECLQRIVAVVTR